VLALLAGEAAAQRVKHLIAHACKTGRPCWITTVKMAEVWYTIAQRRSEVDAASMVAEILEGPLGSSTSTS